MTSTLKPVVVSLQLVFHLSILITYLSSYLGDELVCIQFIIQIVSLCVCVSVCLPALTAIDLFESTPLLVALVRTERDKYLQES